jgi:phage RecT family recombinase
MSQTAQKKSDLQHFQETYQKNLEQYALNKYKKNEFWASFKLAVMENQDLQRALKTDAGKISLASAMRFAISTGLSLNPQEGKAALITYGDVIQYQVMKNGIIELAMQSGKVEFVTADIVRSNDEFRISKTGMGDKYTFNPARKNRGDVDGYYAAMKMKDGVTHVMYMEKSEVESHAGKYSALFRVKPEKSPWSKSFDGMALKTVLKRLFRNIVISRELTAAVSGDDENEVMPERDITPGVSTQELSDKLPDKPETVKPDIPETEPKQTSGKGMF